MIENNKFNCFIIGDDALTIQCSKIIADKGHKVIALFSSNEKVKKWADNHNIKFYDYRKVDIQSILKSNSFDYLFSIVYLNKISDSILLLPKKFSVNYHDSLLPRYGGIHATSWAIMNKEITHGITWHKMSSNIDQGDILKQKQLDIDPKETAASLNFKCYNAAIHTFIELVDELSSNTYIAIKQDINNKSYFSKNKRPPNACIIDFEQTSHEIDVFVRGLNFGRQINTLGVPKILIRNMFFLVPIVQTTNVRSNKEPGVITKICEEFIEVTTLDYNIMFTNVFDINGKELLLSEFVRKLDLRLYDKFENINDNKILQDALNYMYINTLRYEKYWVQKLIECKKYKNNIDKIESTKFMEEFSYIYNKHYKIEFEKRIYVMTCFLHYITSKNKIDTLYIDVMYEDLKNELSCVKKLFPKYIPFKVSVPADADVEYMYETILEEFNVINNNKIYPLEVFYRYSNLERNENAILIEFVNSFSNTYSEIEIRNKYIAISINIKDNVAKVVLNDEADIKCYYIDLK